MKIAIIAYRSPPTIEEAGNRKHGGMSVNLYYLLHGLMHHSIDYAFLYWNSPHNPALRSEFDTEDIDNFSEYLKEKLTSDKIDVVHTLGFFAAEAFKNIRQYSSKLDNIPWVHSNFTTISQRLYFADNVSLFDLTKYEIYKRERTTNLSANHIITGSHAELNELVTIFGNLANVSVINRGVDHSLFYPGIYNRHIQILSAGRMSPIKDFSFLLHSIDYLQKSYPTLIKDKSCVIVGGTETERATLELPKLVKKLNLSSIVKFIDKASHKELSEYMRQSKVFALTSKHETFGLLAEARACGCPTVARNNSSCPEIAPQVWEGQFI
ncbi:MAG: glycosyltransferase [Anaerolineales bacterium]